MSLLPVGKGLAVVADLTIRMGLISAVVLLFLAIWTTCTKDMILKKYPDVKTRYKRRV